MKGIIIVVRTAATTTSEVARKRRIREGNQAKRWVDKRWLARDNEPKLINPLCDAWKRLRWILHTKCSLSLFRREQFFSASRMLRYQIAADVGEKNYEKIGRGHLKIIQFSWQVSLDILLPEKECRNIF